MRINARILGLTTLAVCILLLCCLPLAAQSQPRVTSERAAAFAVSPALRDLPQLPPTVSYGFHETEPPRHVDYHPGRGQLTGIDPVAQTSAVGQPTATLVQLLSVEGIANLCSCYPPDPNAAVGDTQVLEMVNSHIEVFDKTTGTSLLGPTPIHQIFAALSPNRCGIEDDGDPVVLFDKVNHRWLITQFEVTNPAYFCAAVSTSADATSTWNLYAFLTTDFNDYPKWGMWPTGYFVTDNHFNNSGTAYVDARLHAANDVKMRAGDPTAEFLTCELTGNDYSILPADVDSIIPPPAGQAEFFLGSYDVDATNNHLYLYSMAPNFATGGATCTGSGLAQPITVPTYVPFCDSSRSCVPEPGGSTLDALGDRVMFRFAYWNDGINPNVPPCATCAPPRHQHWYVNHTASVSGHAGVRWYEFQTPVTVVNPSSLMVADTGTFSPDSNYRWMASMARDKMNNLAVGYSISSSSISPSVNVAQRTGPGTLGGEQTLFSGTGSQTGSAHRWGDYTSMSLDGSDHCTLWYTNEYIMTTGTAPWRTRMTKLKFDNCN